MKKFKVSQNVVAFAIIIFTVFIVVGTSLALNDKNDLSYNKFLKKVEAKKIETVEIDFNSKKFTAIDTNDKKYTVDNPRYDDFKKDLLESGVEVKENSSSKTFTMVLSMLQLGLLTIFAIYIINMLKTQTGDNKTGEVVNPQEGGKDNKKLKRTTFEDVAGLKQVKQDLSLVVDFLKNPDEYNKAGAKMPKGIVLCGPPGTGKTLLARAVAGEAGVPFFSVSGSDFVEMFVGVGAKRVRDLFKNAKKQSPCIIFIDEIDAIGSSRGYSSGTSEHRQTINALLAEMDGFMGKEGILVMAATNRVEDLDPALIRPGRFDKHITVPLPETQEERMEIINIYKNNKKFADDVNFKALAKETIGFSPADIESLLNEAALISVQNKKDAIDKQCIDDAIYKKLMRGHAKDDDNRDEEELKLVAYHEAGHATIAKLCDMDVSKVTIIKSTSGAGGVNIIVPKKMGLYSADELEEQVKMTYGGRCAEKLLYGNDLTKITTGASADIKQATSIIQQMITQYGMSEKYGMLNLTDLGVDNKTILEEAIKLATELENEAYQMLVDNRDMHQEIVDVLLEKETISGDELDIIYKKYHA